MTERILHITGKTNRGKDFCAGAVFDTKTRKCIAAAPILKWMIGRSVETVIEIIKPNGWSFGWSNESGTDEHRTKTSPS